MGGQSLIGRRSVVQMANIVHGQNSTQPSSCGRRVKLDIRGRYLKDEQWHILTASSVPTAWGVDNGDSQGFLAEM